MLNCLSQTFTQWKNGTTRKVAVVAVTATIFLTLYWYQKRPPSFLSYDNQPENGFHVFETVDLQTSNKTGTQWIVLEVSVQEATSNLEEPSGWNVLVFGERISLGIQKSCKSCVFIDRDTTLRFKGIGIDSSNVMMEAYLYVINSGAQWIYSTNTSADLEEQISGFHLRETAKGLMYTGKVQFEPSFHFGARDVSQRSDRMNYTSYRLGEYHAPLIQRKWQSDHTLGEALSVMCKLPHAFVSAQLSPSVDLMGSLIHYQAFPLLGSVFNTTTVNNISQGQITLPLCSDGLVGFYAPSCKWKYQVKQGYVHTQKSEMSTQGYFKNKAFRLFEYIAGDRGKINTSFNWLGILIKLNITFSNSCRSNAGIPKELSHKPQNVVYEPHVNNTETDPFRTLCKNEYPSQNKSNKDMIGDIMLVVYFSFPSYYSNLIYLNFLYRRYFKYIIYCGPGITNFLKFYQTYPHPLTFVDAIHNGGYFPYMCLSSAVDMGFSVSGYLQIADDVLLNVWTIVDFPRDKIWFQKTLQHASANAPHVNGLLKGETDWHWWRNGGLGAAKLRKVFARLKSFKQSQYLNISQRFINHTTRGLGHNDDAGCYEASDIFYVPSLYAEDFSFLSKICFDEKLFLEIAVPTMLCGLDNMAHILRMNGSYLWYGERNNFAKSFNPSHTFIHAFKLSQLKQQRVISFYCSKYLPHFI